LKQEIISPRFYGPEKAETLLIGWGSTYGVIKESVDMLNKNGGSFGHLHFESNLAFPG